MTVQELSQLALFEEKASRIELFIRIAYGFLLGIMYSVWGFLVAFVVTLQFWHILIFGRRGRSLHDWTRRYLNASLYVNAYLNYLTDTRPDLTPDFDMYYKPATSTQRPQTERRAPTAAPKQAQRTSSAIAAVRNSERSQLGFFLSSERNATSARQDCRTIARASESNNSNVTTPPSCARS
jgi:hypothetical protein